MQDTTHHTYDVIIIGGGASGFFSAIKIAESNPTLSVLILEKTGNVLSKVKISGGGRCNVTHQPLPHKSFAKNYPRGEREIKHLFDQFSAQDTINWFKNKGVTLKTESDGRIFPATDSSQTIIDCFLEQTRKLSIKIKTNCAVIDVKKNNALFTVQTSSDEILQAKYLIVCTGAKPNSSHYEWMHTIQEKITPLHPSLFTFNAKEHVLKNLSGVTVPNARVRIRGCKLEEQGPVLITHWGLSGPCILRLSAWGAIELANKEYNFDALIAWDASYTEAILKEKFRVLMKDHHKKKIVNTPIEPLSKRLWEMLITTADISEELTWNDISNKKANKLIEQLISFPFEVKGKTTFKEEFVVAGGVSLNDVNLGTMESKSIAGLYFAGEVLNIDGITGGFNFQAAWTTAFIAAKHIIKK
jgi:predicted Rossmann fold flavoprotein